METSAKDNKNIAEAFKVIINSNYIFSLIKIETYINTIMRDIKKNQPEKIEKGEGIKISEKYHNQTTDNPVEQKKKCC